MRSCIRMAFQTGLFANLNMRPDNDIQKCNVQKLERRNLNIRMVFSSSVRFLSAKIALYYRTNDT